MVSLQKFLKSRKESKNNFFDRTFWNGLTEKVLIWENKQGRDSKIDPIEIWDMDKARDYLDTLDEEEVEELQSQEPTQIEPVNELIEVKEEIIGDSKPISIKYVNSQDGKVVHEFGEKKDKLEE